MKAVLTVGQVAKYSHVCYRTVCRWFDSGRFTNSYRLPGSSDRRIPTVSLLLFLRQYGMPIHQDLLDFEKGLNDGTSPQVPTHKV